MLPCRQVPFGLLKFPVVELREDSWISKRFVYVRLMFSRNANSQDVFWARSFTPASNDGTSYFGADSLAVLPIRAVILTQGQRCFLVYPELSSGKSGFSRIRTGENNASWLVSIKHNGRIYEATTIYILMEVTVVRMFRPLRHSNRVLFLLSGAFWISYPKHSDISRYNNG